MPTIAISEIKYGKRIREDVGDIMPLVESIREVGLIHPIVLDKNNLLVAGKRRIEAYKFLDETRIPYVTLDVDSDGLLEAEIHENTKRQDFSPTEIAKIFKVVSKRKTDAFRGRDTRDIVAELTNIGHTQVDKILTIVKKAETSEPARRFLGRVEKKKMSVDTAYKLVTLEDRNLPKVPLPDGIFDVISEDASLRFDRGAGARASADGHYDTMTLQEICDLRIPAAENAVFFEWIPTSMKYDTQTVIIHGEEFTGSTLECILKARGCRGVNEFILPKKNPGMGAYNFSCHETCVMAFKGKMPMPLKRFRSVLPDFDGEHSEKPDEFYVWMREMYPKRKYFAAFEVKEREGWVCYGNQLKVT